MLLTPRGDAVINAIPTTYRGVRYRSTLEADWAATLDWLEIYYQYEPEAVTIGDEAYLCDFHLPTIRTWCEAKGPHNERIEKTRALYRALEPDPWNVEQPLVVVLRPPGPGDVAEWEGIDASQEIVLVLCPECRNYGFMDYHGVWQCRRWCRNGGENKFWNLPGGDIFWPGGISFVRAPRPGRQKA